MWEANKSAMNSPCLSERGRRERRNSIGVEEAADSFCQVNFFSIAFKLTYGHRLSVPIHLQCHSDHDEWRPESSESGSRVIWVLFFLCHLDGPGIVNLNFLFRLESSGVDILRCIGSIQMRIIPTPTYGSQPTYFTEEIIDSRCLDKILKAAVACNAKV